MRHFISLVVVLLVSITCKGLERKVIAVSNLSMVVKTTTEQTHWLYGAADFVSKHEDRMDCDANTLWLDNVFTVANGFFTKTKVESSRRSTRLFLAHTPKTRFFPIKDFLKFTAF